ncbi:MAG: phosphate ABC transporter ATP-binding protein [Candidatus Thermoplasmatota archaeon]|nr:phosphate ABC transporter ATP-binding protein [Candidatus Thermoplasmatota archaeon]
MSAPLLELNNVGKNFDGKWVVRGASFKLERGEILALVGPSGAGKTTILRMINLLERPDEGEIKICSEKPNGNALALRRKMVMVSQKPVMFSGTAYDNAAYGLRLRGAPEADIRESVEQALEILGLSGYGHRKARTLSGGEAQRLAFARAAVVQPDIMLLDEFTANLNPSNIDILEKALREYVALYNCGVVLVTHNLFQAKRLADRTGVLLGGKIVEMGSSKEIFENPKTEEGKKFIHGEILF